MTLATERTRQGRIPIRIVEVDVDFCDNDLSDAVNAAGNCDAVPHGNLLTDSEAFDNWTAVRASVSADAANDPNGNATADKLVEDGTASATHLVYQTGVSLAIGETLTHSVYAKAAERTAIRIINANSAPWGGSSCNVVFDLAKGTVISESNATGYIRLLSNGWYQCVMTTIAATVAASTGLQVNLLDSSYSASYNGDGSSGLYLWGGQDVIDLSGSFPYYCKTTTAAVASNCTGMCYKTRATCRDPSNYATTTAQTHRFVENSAGIPNSIDAVPCIVTNNGKPSISTAPTKITPGKGLGYRAQVSVNLQDLQHHDRGIDPYVIYRDYTPESQGTYFGKFKARNPYYQNRPFRLLSGYLNSDGSYASANMDERLYLIHSIEGPDQSGRVTITAKDILSMCDADKAQFPPENTETLSGAYTAGVSTTLALQTGEGASFTNDPFGTAVSGGNPGYVRIGSNILEYTGVSTDTLTGVTGGQFGSTDADAASSDGVQACAYFTQNVVDAIYALLVTGAGISSSYIDYAGDWTTEKTGNLSGFTLDGIVSKPEGINKLVGELTEQCLCNVWWDERTQMVILKSLSPYTADTELTQALNFINVNVKDDPANRISRIIAYYGLTDHVNQDKPESYQYIYADVDTNSEDTTQFGEQKVKRVLSRWFQTQGPIAAFVSRTMKWKRDNPRIATFTIDAKDGALWTGDPFDLVADAIQDEDGSQLSSEFFVVEAQEMADGRLCYIGMDNPFFGRYAIVMANGTADYAGESVGGWIANNTGYMNDGSDAFQIA